MNPALPSKSRPFHSGGKSEKIEGEAHCLPFFALPNASPRRLVGQRGAVTQESPDIIAIGSKLAGFRVATAESRPILPSCLLSRTR